jgi:hypothetical protein
MGPRGLAPGEVPGLLGVGPGTNPLAEAKTRQNVDGLGGGPISRQGMFTIRLSRYGPLPTPKPQKSSATGHGPRGPCCPFRILGSKRGTWKWGGRTPAETPTPPRCGSSGGGVLDPFQTPFVPRCGSSGGGSRFGKTPPKDTRMECALVKKYKKKGGCPSCKFADEGF